MNSEYEPLSLINNYFYPKYFMQIVFTFMVTLWHKEYNLA